MSNIDPSVPVYGVPTTQSVRDNFTVAKTEIEGLQSQITAITPAANGAVQKAGDTMTGLLLLSGAPSNPLGAATKAYVDGAISGSVAFLPITGGTLTGALTLAADPTANLHAATKAYVDTSSGKNTGRNRLINGGFRINQRGYTSGTALTAAAYGHDRWKAGSGGCTYTFTQTQPATTITISAGTLQQIVEAQDVEGGNYTLSWTGSAQGRINAGVYSASPITVTGLAANTAITVEFNAGGTLGTVQLEAGSLATQYERHPYGDSLRRCQRYYQIGQAFAVGYSSAAGNFVGCTVSLPTAMRAAPTMTAGSAIGTDTNVSAVTADNSSAAQFRFVLTATGAGMASGGRNFTASAEL